MVHLPLIDLSSTMADDAPLAEDELAIAAVAAPSSEPWTIVRARYVSAPSLIADARVARAAAQLVDVTSATTPSENAERFVLPASLARAHPRRLGEFVLGRLCARRALGDRSRTLLDVGPERAPIWPTGMIGSISHAGGFAWAVAVSQEHQRGIGVDSEEPLSATAADEIRTTVLTPSDLRLLESSDACTLPADVWLTIVFSAKESVFKCLHPLVQTFFEFADVQVEALDPRRRALELRTLRNLSKEIPAGTTLEARFVTDGDFVHTVVGWPGTPACREDVLAVAFPQRSS